MLRPHFHICCNCRLRYGFLWNSWQFAHMLFVSMLGTCMMMMVSIHTNHKLKYYYYAFHISENECAVQAYSITFMPCDTYTFRTFNRFYIIHKDTSKKKKNSMFDSWFLGSCSNSPNPKHLMIFSSQFVGFFGHLKLQWYDVFVRISCRNKSIFSIYIGILNYLPNVLIGNILKIDTGAQRQIEQCPLVDISVSVDGFLIDWIEKLTFSTHFISTKKMKVWR